MPVSLLPLPKKSDTAGRPQQISLRMIQSSPPLDNLPFSSWHVFHHGSLLPENLAESCKDAGCSEELSLAGVGYQQQFPAAQQFPTAFVPQYGLAQMGGMQQMPQQRVGLPAEGTFCQPSQHLQQQQQQQQRQIRQQQQPRQIRQQKHQQPRAPGPVSRQSLPHQPPPQRAQPRQQPAGRTPASLQGALHLYSQQPSLVHIKMCVWRPTLVATIGTCLAVFCWVDRAHTSQTTTSNTRPTPELTWDHIYPVRVVCTC